MELVTGGFMKGTILITVEVNGQRFLYTAQIDKPGEGHTGEQGLNLPDHAPALVALSRVKEMLQDIHDLDSLSKSSS